MDSSGDHCTMLDFCQILPHCKKSYLLIFRYLQKFCKYFTYLVAYLCINLGEVWFKKILQEDQKLINQTVCTVQVPQWQDPRERVQLSYSCLTFVVNSLKKGRGTTFWNLPRFLLSHKLFRTEAHTARLLTYLLSIGELTVFQDNFWLKSWLEWSRMNVLKRIWCQMLQGK